MVSNLPSAAAIGVLAALLLTPWAGRLRSEEAPASGTAATLRLRGLEHGYNLDYPEAQASFREAMRTDPADPAAPRMAAVTIWMRLLFNQGSVTVEDYLGQVRSDVTRPAPDPEMAAEFKRLIDLATSLAEKKVKANPQDPEAHFHLGAAAALRASYVATIEGKVGQSASTARRAYASHKRSLTLDPSRAEAGLIVGAYRHTVAGLPLHLRLLARLAGLDGGRAQGLALVEAAAARPGPVQPNALFTLVLLYTRENRHDDALKTVRTLQQRFPRNRLLWLEEAGAASRGGRHAEALLAVDRGLAMIARDPRPKALGEPARWKYMRGVILVSRRDPSADTELTGVLDLEPPGWLRGRTHLERGKLRDLSEDRTGALQAYRLALSICRTHDDAGCSEAARGFIARPYRDTREP